MSKRDRSPRVGIALRAALEEFTLASDVDFVEVITENVLSLEGVSRERLERALARFRVVPHGVSLGIGNTCDLDGEHLRSLRRLVEHVDAPWFSDHLCWTELGGLNHHELLPLPRTLQTARYVAARAREVQDRIGRPFALENPSQYDSLSADEMPPGAFLSEVVEGADVGILLDLQNVVVSATHLGFEPLSYLRRLPLERVLQVHLAGAILQPDGTLIDTHDARPSPLVFELYEWLIAEVGPLPTLLEWDARFPSHEELDSCLRSIRRRNSSAPSGRCISA